MSKSTLSLLVFFWLTLGSALADDFVAIITKTGYLVLNQVPGNYFSIEIQASEMPEPERFSVGKNQLQITSLLVSDFLDNPSELSDSRAILERHSESEKGYLEENVVHEPLVLTSHYENGSLYWIAKGSQAEFRVCTTLHNQSVIMLSAVISDQASAETVVTRQKNSWATLKFRSTPWSTSEIATLSKHFRAAH
jgi:hypothetical protein